MSYSETAGGSGSRFWRIAIRVVIPIAFAGFLYYIFTEVARFGTVVSDSMVPTLEVGSWYILRVDAYNGRSPERGEIVVFEAPDGHFYAKRVVAIENDQIGTLSGRVFLNGEWIEEPYVREDSLVMEATSVTRVPEDHVFLLGDNRNHSEDSRDYGPVPTDMIMGEVRKIIWPPSRARVLSPARSE